eukprot:jgi/Undpi1/7482/HiC_scaffold_22.g09955.m1
MEVDEGPSVPSSPPSKAQQPQYALDSDDETLRFDNDDDLYSSDLDEVDAQWVRKQHLPAAYCGEELPATGGGGGGDGDCANDDDDDDYDSDDCDDADEDDDNVIASAPAAATASATAAAATASAADTPTAAGDGTGDARAGGEGAGWKPQRPQAKKKKGRARTMGVVSDAQLSCPLCFTTFRAVTGINVVVKSDEFLTMEQLSGGARKRQTKGGKGKGKRGNNNAMRAAAPAAEEEALWEGGGQGRGGEGEGGGGRAGGGGERFNPVCCGECDHRVGVIDEEEVLHFFNVIASG